MDSGLVKKIRYNIKINSIDFLYLNFGYYIIVGIIFNCYVRILSLTYAHTDKMLLVTLCHCLNIKK